jgi:DNA-damage-inducible protein J
MNMKESTVTAKIDSNLKREAEEILSKIGLDSSTAINLFYSNIVLNKGLPFRLRINSIPQMDEKEHTETEKILRKRKPADRKITRSENIQIAL